MRVVDLFSGLGGWSSAFADRGHSVITIDQEPRFHPSICANVLSLKALPECDVVLASPPCEAFSVAAIGKNWLRDDAGALHPKSTRALDGLTLLLHTLELISKSTAKYSAIENPRGAMRKMSALCLWPRRTVTYCQYGLPYMKPTDIWGEFPPTWRPKEPCSNGASCHVAAPRGSRTGLQGVKSVAERAKIPYALSLEFCLACEEGRHGKEGR